MRCPECGSLTDRHSTECGASWSPDYRLAPPRLDPVGELRRGLEDAAATFGLMAAVFSKARDVETGRLLLAARNKATAALDRAGFPYQEDQHQPKGN